MNSAQLRARMNAGPGPVQAGAGGSDWKSDWQSEDSEWPQWGEPKGMPPAGAPPIGGGGPAFPQHEEEEERMEAPKPVEVVQYNDEGLPVRPGMQKCGFYLRAGKCNYGPSCRFDHPAGLGGIMAGPSGFGSFPLLVGGSQTNEAGMARRPGKDQCPFLSRTGSCPFGQECRFDHAPGSEGGGGGGGGSGGGGGGSDFPNPLAAPAAKPEKDRGLGG